VTATSMATKQVAPRRRGSVGTTAERQGERV
jgi:hypothetical protein